MRFRRGMSEEERVEALGSDSWGDDIGALPQMIRRVKAAAGVLRQQPPPQGNLFQRTKAAADALRAAQLRQQAGLPPLRPGWRAAPPPGMMMRPGMPPGAGPGMPYGDPNEARAMQEAAQAEAEAQAAEQEAMEMQNLAQEAGVRQGLTAEERQEYGVEGWGRQVRMGKERASVIPHDQYRAGILQRARKLGKGKEPDARCFMLAQKSVDADLKKSGVKVGIPGAAPGRVTK